MLRVRTLLVAFLALAFWVTAAAPCGPASGAQAEHPAGESENRLALDPADWCGSTPLRDLRPVCACGCEDPGSSTATPTPPLALPGAKLPARIPPGPALTPDSQRSIPSAPQWLPDPVPIHAA